MDLLHIHNVDALRNENLRLLTENGELHKMVGLMQENLDLRCTLKEHESQVRTISPPAKTYKEIQVKETEVVKEQPHIISCRDPKHLQHCQKILGEIAFQLDRRILSYIFLEQSRIYGFTVSNAQEKILQATICPLTKKVDEVQRSEMKRRYTDIMNRLKKLGYDTRVHPILCEFLVNTYGIIKHRPEPGTSDWESYNDSEFLCKMATDATPADSLKDVHILINCLVKLANKDGKRLFIW